MSGNFSFPFILGGIPPSGAGSGSVTSVSVTTAAGVSGTVATATSTPAITIALGAITPTSVVASAAVTSGTTVSDALGDVRLIVQNSKSAAYTTVLADSGKHLLHPSGDANARTFTIDSNANVAYVIGTAITFVNQTANVLSIAITSDTMTLANSTTTGTRSLAQNGIATALKVSSTGWIISGTGLT